MSVLRRYGGGFVPTRFVVVAGLVLAVMALSCHPAVAQAPKTKPATKTGPATKTKTGPATKTKPGPATKTKPATKPAGTEAYIELSVDDSLKSNAFQVREMLEAATLNPAQSTAVTDYYTKYALSRWTRIADRAEVQKYRKWLRGDLQKAKGAAHDQVVDLVLKFMADIAKNNHHPVARVNAMLMIGELNQAEAITAADNMVPLPAALPVLLVAAEDSQLPDAVRVAALLGINRHAELGGVTTSEQQKAVATVLVRLALAEPVPGRSPASHAWIRAMAIDSLGAMGSAGPMTGQVLTTLLGIAGEEAAPFPVRCAAARALGKLTRPKTPGVAPAAVVRQMGQLAVATVNAEIDGHANKNAPFVRRRLQTRLIAIHNGLEGLASSVTEEADVTVHANLVNSIKKCLETLEDKDAADADVIKSLTSQCDAILRGLEAPAAKPKPKED